MGTFIFRVILNFSVPLIVGFIKKGSLNSKQCTLIAIGWAICSSIVILFMTGSIAEAIGNGVMSAILGDIVIYLASKPQKMPQHEESQTNAVVETQDATLEEEEATELEEEATLEDIQTTEMIDTVEKQDVEITEQTNIIRDTLPEKELRQLKDLYDAGVLTEEEFKNKKRMLLGI